MDPGAPQSDQPTENADAPILPAPVIATDAPPDESEPASPVSSPDIEITTEPESEPAAGLDVVSPPAIDNVRTNADAPAGTPLPSAPDSPVPAVPTSTGAVVTTPPLAPIVSAPTPAPIETAPAFDEKSFIRSYLDRIRPAALASKAVRHERRLERILALIDKEGSLARRDMELLLHIATHTAQNYCEELLRRGLIKKVGASEMTRYERA